MANKKVFSFTSSAFAPVRQTATLPVADTVNSAGGKAYLAGAEHQLAQFVNTGTFNDTLTISAENQVATVISLCHQVSPQYIAQTALEARFAGFMKDSPALLMAVLLVRDGELFERAFPVVMDSLKQVRTFMQIVRSGVVGRKSFGSRAKRVIRNWLENCSEDNLFRQSVGNNPSLADMIKMVHPRASNEKREALYGYLVGNKVVKDRSQMTVRTLKNGVNIKETVLTETLPSLVQNFEMYKTTREGTMPSVPFEMLATLATTEGHWREIAEKATWTQTFKNLNTFERHGVFKDIKITNALCERLRNAALVRRAKVFPYSLMMAHDMASANASIPRDVTTALEAALNVATENVPLLEGMVYIFVDVSGSMDSNRVTGARKGATTKVTCRDVSALIAASIAKRNGQAVVMPFSDRLYPSYSLDTDKSVLENAKVLRKLPSGGTMCSLTLAHLNATNVAHGDKSVLCIYVSDNESYLDSQSSYATQTMVEWAKFKARNPNAKLVCIDLVPNNHSQAKESKDVMNIGGWSDNNFKMIAAFSRGEFGADFWVNKIKSLELSSADVGTKNSLVAEED